MKNVEKHWIMPHGIYPRTLGHPNTVHTALSMAKRSVKNWLFSKMDDERFVNKTIKCKKLPTIVLGRKNVTRPFGKRK